MESLMRFFTGHKTKDGQNYCGVHPLFRLMNARLISPALLAAKCERTEKR